jgi:hypothetical protein
MVVQFRMAAIETLKADLPILFAYIGWAKLYDGTELIAGNFDGLLPNSKTKNWESNAFRRGSDQYYYCGIGKGDVSAVSAHIAFVARDTSNQLMKLVGIYAAATLYEENGYGWARTKHARLVPELRRPQVPGWPGAQGVRRWASRGGASVSPPDHSLVVLLHLLHLLPPPPLFYFSFSFVLFSCSLWRRSAPPPLPLLRRPHLRLPAVAARGA